MASFIKSTDSSASASAGASISVETGPERYPGFHFAGEQPRRLASGEFTRLCLLPRVQDPKTGEQVQLTMKDVFAYFTSPSQAGSDKVLCHLCGDTFRKDWSNNKRHFERAHVVALPPDLQKQAGGGEAATAASAGTAFEDPIEVEGPIESSTSSRKRGRPAARVDTGAIDSFFARTAKRDVSMAAAVAVAADFLPFRAFEKPGLRSLLQYLDVDVSELALSRATIQRRVRSLYDDVFSQVQDVARRLMGSGSLNFSMDTWTSGSRHAMVGMTLSGVDSDFTPLSITAGFAHLPGSHTKEALRNAALQLIDDLGIPVNASFTMVGDSASAQATAFDIDDNVTPSNCVAHLLDLSVEAAALHLKPQLEDLQWMSKRLLNSPLLLSVTDKFGILRPVRAAATRWSSNYYAIARMLQILPGLEEKKEEIVAVMALKKDKEAFRGYLAKLQKHAPTFQLVLPALQAVAAYQQALSVRKQPTMSTIPHLHRKILDVVKTQLTDAESQDREAARKTLNALQTDVHRRLSDFSSSPVVRTAVMLDPRFAVEALVTDADVSFLKQQLQDLHAILTASAASATAQPASAAAATATAAPSVFQRAKTSSSTNRIAMEWDSFLTVLDELAKQHPDARATMDPYQWWTSIAPRVENIAVVARRVLTIPATSADVERLFSRAAVVDTARRAQLTPANLARLTLLSQWLSASQPKPIRGIEGYVGYLSTAAGSAPAASSASPQPQWPPNTTLDALNDAAADDAEVAETGASSSLADTLDNSSSMADDV